MKKKKRSLAHATNVTGSSSLLPTNPQKLRANLSNATFVKENEDDGAHLLGHLTPRRWAKGTWEFYPGNMETLHNEKQYQNILFRGWIPDEPFIEKETVVTTFGSCFAWEIRQYMVKQGFKLTDNVVFRAGVNSTFAVRQLFEWVFENKTFYEQTWHREDATVIKKTEKLRVFMEKELKETNVFVITVGVGEVWYNKETNDVFWRAIPDGQYDEKIHGCRVSSFAENKENFHKIFNLIKKHNPDAQVVFTISPVPLNATFRPVSCLTASQVTKSILRGSVDEFFREADGHNRNDLWYFPSYDIVKEIFSPVMENGGYSPDGRHLSKECVEKMMGFFMKYYAIK